MAGLYIHIPFCRSKCAYCDFFSLPLNGKSHTEDAMRAYCDAILQEFRLRCNEIQEPFKTIYIGGGTPTALPFSILTLFLKRISSMVEQFNRELTPNYILPISEFTIEANPEDISPENIELLRECGVNRISIGIQSFNHQQLVSIQRFHDAETSLKALTILKDSKINYSADLIYGLPEESFDSWQQQLEQLLSYCPPHFSAYLLSYEPGTRLYARKQRGLVEEADEATAVAMYDLLIKTAAKYGYHHYEISNFSRPGREAIHNSAYWDLTPYLGLGCSAHSFDGTYRRINPLHLNKYITSINANHSAAEIDEESEINRLNDYIITSLRTSRGLSLRMVEQRWGRVNAIALKRLISPMLLDGRLTNIESVRPDENAQNNATDEGNTKTFGKEIDEETDKGRDKELEKERNKERDKETSTGTYRIPEDHWLTADAIMRDLLIEE